MEKSNEQQQAIIEALSRNPKAFDDDNPEKGCFELAAVCFASAMVAKTWTNDLLINVT
jgi:hypothetical protein